MTSAANKFYHSDEWREIRTKVFERDDFSCKKCGRRGVHLEANHIKPRSRFPGLALVLENLETLCKKCHSAETARMYAAGEL